MRMLRDECKSREKEEEKGGGMLEAESKYFEI